ncbi:MAG: Eco57I restriction-modification methylase domain-containing protein [Actinomycetota bacterium]|nr:Eco57I restriction-modification methylase domain-containing protein [Nitrospiraceae bacterium]MDA8157195.1 Eco57I restriction-modification methylase domain-containing protein [Actinomycetota bacterium]
MTRDEAARLVKETFDNPFDEDRFRLFAKNLLNELDESKAQDYRGAYIPDAFKEHVRSYKRIGKYTDPNGTELDVLAVYLKKEAALERARTMQRNFVARYLKQRGEKDAAIVAFCTDGLPDWRFSFVHMDYRTVQEESGKVKVKEDLTPARRYSFLVGVNEPNHTAQQQLAPLLESEKNPVLSEIERAFNIESVTKEFFSRYKNLFLSVKEELDGLVSSDKRIKAEFEKRNIETGNFAKKLLGQIVFLYFIQKKGWLGVEKDKPWGSGPKNFMRKLFDKEIASYDNFFNDILEPLFYEALAIDRGEVSFYSRFNCKIPFLNGGLFEPINGYNWEEIDIFLKNETLREIFNTFDLYNFTVREDEPLEREVAVDPEMLGKVFENLLEIKDRKSKGAYYTPREIVHYMCQESLIEYLDTALGIQKMSIANQKQVQKKLIGEDDPDQEVLTVIQKPIPRSDIEAFVRRGDFAINNDLAKEQGTTSYKYKMPESIRSNAILLDDKLASIKICDPAIGSGAFPVGIMHEIIRARETLTTYILPPLAYPYIKDIADKKRTAYDFKRHAIQESIYGVDIDAGAVDIAKLRLWLSLVVDEDDFKSIKPLPNLDYKIVCGNSLSSVNEMFHHGNLKELENQKQKYFEETNPRKKAEFKENIDGLLKEITHEDRHFDFKIYFSEVFQKGGFDIVIANPPYVRQESIKDLKPALKKEFGDFYCGMADIYTYFYKRGVEILRPGGHLCFIAPNKFMRAGYGKNTRLLLALGTTPRIVIDFCDLPIFDATTYPSIILIENRYPGKDEKALTATFTNASQLERLEETLQGIGFPMPVSSLREEGWNLERPEVLALMEKLRKAGVPLGEYVHGKFYYGIKTGLNEAFVIDEETRQKLISEDPKSKELIKPWLRGRDIKKWQAGWAGLYVINIASSSNKQWPWSDEMTEGKARKIFDHTYPAVNDYLSQWEDRLTKRDDQGKFWWELRSCAYYEEFEAPKIVYPNITKTNIFAFDTSGVLTNQKCFIIPTDDLCLLAILNSKLVMQWFESTLPLLRGGFFEPGAIFMQHFPVALGSEKQKASIIERVKKILSDSDSSAVTRLEGEINKLVYALYGLTPEEIDIVEGKG